MKTPTCGNAPFTAWHRYRQLARYLIPIAILLLGLGLPTLTALGAEEKAEGPDQYYSVRGTVYSKRLKHLEEHGYGANLRLQLSAAVYRYRSLDDILNKETRHLQSLGLRPKFSFSLPTRWPYVTFNPGVELSVVRQRDLERTLVSGAVSAGLAYENGRKEGHMKASATLKYGTRYDEDGLNLDGYLKFTLRSSLRRSLNWAVGDSLATVTPFAAASYFIDKLDLGVRQGFDQNISEQYEIGITFGTLPRLRFWKIKLPEIDVSFTYSDNLKGIKIRF